MTGVPRRMCTHGNDVIVIRGILVQSTVPIRSSTGWLMLSQQNMHSVRASEKGLQMG